jgi:TRAP-type C4-dicarboxylate transport system permease small subunit
METLERMSGKINLWVEYLLFGLGFTMATLVAVQVFFRYVLNHSLFWSEELARYFLVWLTFLGASVAYYRKVHPGIDIFYLKMNPSWQKIIAIFVHLISMSLFMVMVYYGCKFSFFVKSQISPALHLPKWLIFSIIPISGFILLVHSLAFMIKELKRPARDH